MAGRASNTPSGARFRLTGPQPLERIREALLIAKPSFFQRFLLPGITFKAVVIGGGYATGRELAEFFFPTGPLGGLYGMLLAMAIWSLVCAVAFALSHHLRAYDYRTLMQSVLGPFWVVFEVFYVLFLILILAVMSAAAGEIGAALFGWPPVVGTLLLMAAVAATTSFGNDGVERVFRFTSGFLYLVYALFLVLAITYFSDGIGEALTIAPTSQEWIVGGATYASYNFVAAIAVLPFIRRLTSRRDAIVAGALAGPLAMAPALVFFLSMSAFYPEIAGASLPSDFVLEELGLPWFQLMFQLMIFCALVETGVGVVNALNERIEVALENSGRGEFSFLGRLGVAAVLLLVSGFAAVRFGLVDLIAQGYGAFGYIMLAILVLPLMTVGLWRLARPAWGKTSKGDANT
ncbi:hypothetical protein [Qipengyuania sp. MTN3-11]|uniref:YkvI family membrane protein n=1 Tax=Qipengyuania sp. MTN3-11 TaxID=3056557 RepID=UPI0036F33782